MSAVLIRHIIMERNLMALTEQERDELARRASSRTLNAGEVFRANLILALADGRTYAKITALLQTSAPTISRWKQRFEQPRLDGLNTRNHWAEEIHVSWAIFRGIRPGMWRSFSRNTHG
jgi:Helix-turn-helix domain